MPSVFSTVDLAAAQSSAIGVASHTDDLTIRERDGVTIVRFNTESLLGHDIQHISDRIRALIEGGVRLLVLDFKHVHYAGSAALGMALALSKALDRLGGKLALSHTDGIEDLLKVTRARLLFTIAPDAKTAVELLSGSDVPPSA